jgi:hypothetical protein
MISFKKIILSLLVFISCSQLQKIEFKKMNSFGSLDPNKALVYFLKYQGEKDPIFIIHHQNKKSPQILKKIGILKNQSYFYLSFDPGAHSFIYSEQISVDPTYLNLNLEAGQTYYILLNEFQAGIFSTPTTHRMLKKITASEALPEFKTLREINLIKNQALFHNQ